MSTLYWVAFRVDDTKIKLSGNVNGTETKLSHMAFSPKSLTERVWCFKSQSSLQ